MVLTENAMLCRLLPIALFAVLGIPAHAATPPLPAASRGELLYSTHCIACHTTQVHWRDKKRARDWASLQAEVNNWQKLSGLGWNEDDVVAVARYLNARCYHYPAPE